MKPKSQRAKEPKNIFLNKITEEALSGKTITLEQANQLKGLKEDDLYSLFNAAYKIRNKFRGKKVELCAITNARSGSCGENCAFCAQSSWNKTKVKVYPLLEEKEILKKAAQAQRAGA